MECPNCGAEIEGRPGLCPACGFELPVERGGNRCPACGARVAEEAETCDMCGAVLTERGEASLLLAAVESLLVALAVVVLLGSIWLLRPREVQPSAGPLPTPLPTSTATPTRPPKTPTPTVTSTPTITPTPLPPFITYTVQAGDTLIGIAMEYGTTVEAIVAASGLSGPEELLQIGQELRIPLKPEALTPEPSATPVPVTGLITHTVQEGDTLYFLAIQYDTTVEAIMEANGITDPKEFLQVGQVLIISAGTPAPTATPISTPSPTATLTPTLTPWPTPLPRATPRFPYPAPILLSPPDDSGFQGETTVLLNWASVGILAEDEWYVVQVRYTRQGEVKEVEEWVKATSWRLPPSLGPQPDEPSRVYQWDVIVLRRPGLNKGIAISPRSETRRFRWSP